MTYTYYRREFGSTIKLNFRKCSGTSSAPGPSTARAMQGQHHCEHCDADAKIFPKEPVVKAPWSNSPTCTALAPKPGSRGFSSTHSTIAFAGGATSRPTTWAPLAVKIGSVLSHQLASREVDLVAAQEPQDILDFNNAQPRPAGARSRGRSPLAAAYPGASVSAYRWPSYRSAACQAAACPAVLQGLGGITMPPQADNPRLDPDFLGYRPRAAPRPPATKLSAPAPNRAAMSPVSGSMPQAACELSSKAGIIPMLDHDSRFMKSGYSFSQSRAFFYLRNPETTLGIGVKVFRKALPALGALGRGAAGPLFLHVGTAFVEPTDGHAYDPTDGATTDPYPAVPACPWVATDDPPALPCAMAAVLKRAKAVASTIVVSFMIVSFLVV
jgi:hypothetical protein